MESLLRAALFTLVAKSVNEEGDDVRPQPELEFGGNPAPDPKTSPKNTRLPDAVLPLDDSQSGTINYKTTTGSGLVS